MSLRRPHTLVRCIALVLAVAAAAPALGAERDVTGTPATAPDVNGPGAARDSVVALVRRMRRYFETHETDGVTMDSRYAINPSEAIRQSVVCQVLGYCELYRAHPTGRLRHAIVRHADYLLPRLDQVRSGTPFDGMLGDCLLQAYELTREPRFLAAGRTIEDEIEAIPTYECILNGGLMVAMATADFARLTGSASALQKTHAILGQLPPYQNDDGSFPHWCWGSRDIHYTGWMAQELIQLGRRIDDPVIAPTLARMNVFMAGRMNADGTARYEEPCPDDPGCVIAYYSRGSGCGEDYDTRGWTVEPGYQTLLFDHFRQQSFTPVLGWLLSLEHGGTFADKWGWFPTPDDPEYAWEVADTSVANMSIIFWSMAMVLSGRPPHDAALAALDDDPEQAFAPAPASSPPAEGPGDVALSATPNPARAGCELRFALPRAGLARVVVCDVAGRRVRTLLSAPLAAGAHDLAWDLCDDAGRSVGHGLYFVRLEAAGVTRATRVLALP
jgi:flagellar hook capping protein FlgD